MRRLSYRGKVFGAILIAEILFIILLVPHLDTANSLDSCTIFTVSRDGTTFFCNNEDEGLRHGRIWFIPGSDEEYGTVLFGYGIYRNAMIPVGGMNDQGLILDMTMVSETEVRIDPEKPTYDGSYFLEMLRECETTDEAKQWIRSYNLLLLNWQQAHIADRNGNAVAIGLDASGSLKMTNKSGDFLVTTNFNLAQDDGSHQSSGRYAMTVSMLTAMSELSLDNCRSVLESVSMESTMYSYIGDLGNRILYLYSRADFDRNAVLNVTQELSLGEHSYDIERLVSSQSSPTSSRDIFDDAIGILLAGFIISVSTLVVLVQKRRYKS